MGRPYRIPYGSRRYINSISTAQTALGFLEKFACGSRGPNLSLSETLQCLSVSLSDIPELCGDQKKTEYNVLEVWEYAQWCRARDVLRYFSWDKNSVRIWQDNGMVEVRNLSWFHGDYALTLYDAYRVNKYMRTRAHLMKILGPVPQIDTDCFSLLPMTELSCLLSRPSLVRQLATPISYNR